jgi:hypothetical protein
VLVGLEQPIPLGQYATISSVSLALIAFVGGLIVDLKQNRSGSLENYLARAGAGGAIPTALVLICCAFKPSLISELSGLNVPIAAAGLSLLYVSIKGLIH